nr:hypothetical protein [Tanacetum cinerariifolium]
MDQNTNSSGFDQSQPPQLSSKEISNDEFKIMMQSYFERMNQSREQEKLLAEQELRHQEQATQEKEGPPQDFNIRQFIREECCIEVWEEQRQNMENTILELVKICQQKELYCMNDNDLIESALNSPEYSPSMGYEHPNTTPETESDEIIKSDDKKECDMLFCENSPICDDHSEIFSDSNNDDDISSDDDAFEDIEYVEASFPDPKIVSLAEENDVYVEEEEVDLEDIFQIPDVILREKLLSINRLIANIESLNDNPTPDCDNFSPEFETFCDHTEETRSGSTTAHDSLPKYDSFCFEIETDQESEASDFDNPSFPRPPPEPPDAKPNAGEEISVVMNDNDKLECLDLRDEIDEDNDYFPFMFVIQIFLQYLIYPKVFSFLLSAESEDTIFDPDISV